MTSTIRQFQNRECVKKNRSRGSVVLLSRRADPERDQRSSRPARLKVSRLLEKGHQSGIIRVRLILALKAVWNMKLNYVVSFAATCPGDPWACGC